MLRTGRKGRVLGGNIGLEDKKWGWFEDLEHTTVKGAPWLSQFADDGDEEDSSTEDAITLPVFGIGQPVHSAQR